MPQLKKPKYINPFGPKDAKIVIVLDLPNKDEELTGISGVGESGRLLTQFLMQAKINRSSCYITNIIKYRAPSNIVGRLNEIGINRYDEEANTRKEIELIKPNVIIPMGSLALDGIMGLKSIQKYRGSILEYKGMKVIPTINPAFVSKEFKSSCLLINDLVKARNNSYSSVLQRKKTNFILRPDFNHAIRLLDEYNNLKTNHFNNGTQTCVALDIETNMGADYIKCVGFAKSPHEAFVIPFVENFKPTWTTEEEIALWKRIRLILINPNIGKIIQNLMFECSVMRPWIGEINPIYMDTMIAHHLILPEVRKGLDMLTSIYTNEPYYKDDAKDNNYEGDSLLEYNCKDTSITYEVALEEEKALFENNLYKFYHDYQNKFARIMEWASYKGVKVDLDKVREHRARLWEELKETQLKLNKLVGHPINVDSPKQISNLLYEEMALPKQFHRKTKKLTTDEDTISKLAKKFPNLIFDLILKIRGNGKLISTYLGATRSGGTLMEKPFWDENSICHASWNICGTETGRLSSSENNVTKMGINFQNQPSEIRDIFIPREGFVFIKFDLSQVEARLVAYMSQDLNMIKVFEEDRDIHILVASMVFNKPERDIPHESIERKKAKKLGHSANYKIGVRQFANTAGIPEREAKILLTRYYTLFGIGKWHEKVQRDLELNRTITTPLGRKRTFFDRWGDQLFRSAIAYEPQSTASDFINQAAVRINSRLSKRSSILLQVHDELVIEVPREEINSTVKIIEEELKHRITIHGREVSIPIDLFIGEKNWKDVVGWDEWKKSYIN